LIRGYSLLCFLNEYSERFESYITLAALTEESDLNNRKDFVKIITFLVEEGVEVNAVNNEGATAFMNLAAGGEVDLLRLLVERGADPKAIRDDGSIALHMAAHRGNFDACRYLIEECGLDINTINKRKEISDLGLTPLYLAAGGESLKICEYLLQSGASVDAGYQPLICAVSVYTLYSNLHIHRKAI
jgi:hypothetical protein